MYLTIAKLQYLDEKFAGYYNVGPDDHDCVTTGDLVDLFCSKWNEGKDFPVAARKNNVEKYSSHEATFLKLDTSKVKSVFGWHPHWHIERAVEETVKLSKVWLNGEDVRAEMDKEINSYKNML